MLVYLGMIVFICSVIISIWYFISASEVPTEAEIVRSWDGREIDEEIRQATLQRQNFRLRSLVALAVGVVFGLTPFGLFIY